MKKIFKILLPLLFILNTTSCYNKKISISPKGFENIFSEHDNKKHNFLNQVVKPLFPQRLKSIYDHSILKPLREKSDCDEKPCPYIDVWQYRYLAQKGYIISKNPVASQKEHWKSPKEARIIAISLFGDKKLYYDLLLEYIESIKLLSEINGFPHQNWGLESFTIRVYAAKRNPQHADLGPLLGEVPDQYIDLLIKNGIEVALVDNGLDKVSLDATFWRFLVANEPMPEKESIRYLVRDADWKATALELYALAHWMKEKHDSFHRMQPHEVCLVPVTASLWGAKHTGQNYLSPNIKDSIMEFPYRLQYGDDEMYLYYIIWAHMKKHKIIHTYTYERARNNIKYLLGSPYRDSSEEPTRDFCLKFGNHKCFDHRIPGSIAYPKMELGFRKPFSEWNDRKYYFNFDRFRKNKKELQEIFDILK